MLVVPMITTDAIDQCPRSVDAGRSALRGGAQAGLAATAKGLDDRRLLRTGPTSPARKIEFSLSTRRVCLRSHYAYDGIKTDAYEQSRRNHKKVGMLFAHLKRIMKRDRLRLRGLIGAHDKFLLAAAAQTQRRMAKWLCPTEPETANMAI